MEDNFALHYVAECHYQAQYYDFYCFFCSVKCPVLSLSTVVK